MQSGWSGRIGLPSPPVCAPTVSPVISPDGAASPLPPATIMGGGRHAMQVRLGGAGVADGGGVALGPENCEERA